MSIESVATFLARWFSSSCRQASHPQQCALSCCVAPSSQQLAHMNLHAASEAAVRLHIALHAESLLGASCKTSHMLSACTVKVGLSKPRMNSCMHLFVQSFTYSVTNALTYSLTYSLNHSLTHSLNHSRTHALTYSYTYLANNLLTQIAIHKFRVIFSRVS